MATQALLLLLPLLFFQVLCQTDVSVAPMEKAEQETLYLMIQGFVGKRWDGSGLYADPCGWTPIQGVSCDLSNGLWYVTSVSIGPILDNSLQCSSDANFSPHLFQLKHLKSLTIFNCFSSPTNQQKTIIPPHGWDELAQSLETLEFRSNEGLTGEIPPILGQLVHLQSLILIDNSLTGVLPQELGSLLHLKRLTLSGNRFWGAIPASLGTDMAELLILDLSRNYLTGPLHPSIGGLTSLLKLDLSNNLLNGSLPNELGNLRNLTLLDIRNNKLSGGLTQSLESMVSLQDMLLSNNPVGGSLMELGWEKMENLTNLDLSNMGLVGEIPESISGLRRLRFLALDNNCLSGTVSKSLAALPSLNALYLSGNNFSGELGFSEEFYERMGSRFASWNNPNLCYSGGVMAKTEHAPVGVEECRQSQEVLHNVIGDSKVDNRIPYQNSNLMTSFGLSVSSASGVLWVILMQEVMAVFLLVLY